MAKVSRGKSTRSSAAARKTGGKTGQRAALGSAQVANLAGDDPQHAARGADRQDLAASSDHLLQGYIDEASRSRITGWVWNPQQPDSPITLDLADGDTRLAKVMANQYRSDLRQAGIGDGRHAFAVPLGEELLPSARNVLHLRCAETGTEVPGSPVIIERVMPVLFGPGTWDGVLEVSNGIARGWVAEPTSKLNEPLVIQIVDQYGTVVGDAPCALGTSSDDATFVQRRFEAPLGQECFGR